MIPGDEFSIHACPSQVTAVLPTPDILVSLKFKLERKIETAVAKKVYKASTPEVYAKV